MHEPEEFEAAVDLPAAVCPVCREEMFVLGGRLLQHGDRNGDCAGSGRPA